jgi:hypothetical protein
MLPTLDEVQPYLLTRIGASAMYGLMSYGYLERPPVHRTMPERAPQPAGRTYKSRYVGVTEHRGRWLAQWGPKGHTKGKVYPLTPEGELSAAWERARVLGLSEPEVRS